MATKASITKKLGRVRPPRVHITYDVHIGDAIEKREIPFVVGVMADLSGQSDKPIVPLKDRKFTEVDATNLDTLMAKLAPRLAFKVDNTLRPADGKLGIELRFKQLADFEPQNVARQVKPLNDLLELRTKLSNLRSSLYGNDKLEELLKDAVAKTEALRKRSSEAAAPVESPEKKG